jgi:hypothetical protein
VILEWAAGNVTSSDTRNGVIGIYSGYKEGWGQEIDSTKLQLSAATNSSLVATGETDAHLYYATKTRTWSGWSSSDLYGFAISDTAMDAWNAGTFTTKFTVDLSNCVRLCQGQNMNLAVAWANDVWNDQTDGVDTKANGGAGVIATQSWPILWVPSL